MPKSLAISLSPRAASTVPPTHGITSFYLLTKMNYAVTFSAPTTRKDNITKFYSWVECM